MDYFTLTISNYHDSRDTTNVRSPLAVLTALFDRIGRYQPAAIIGGFAINPLVTATAPEFGTAVAQPSRCAPRGDLRIARPQGRDDDHRRDGDVRI